ncbi:hypothetical protein [Acidianus sp. HS-5]|uniref:hypothetical protein n=1 Tax=Acidianus sp. HS-5 TaxID=2886040 RepID=UPI001F442A16|nr:hypothetical protein [Acidianus sp. HS-5]
MSIYKFGNYYIAGVSHVVRGYLQDIVLVYKEGNNWKIVSAERFRTNDTTLGKIVNKVKFAVHEDDLKNAVDELKKSGIKLEEVNNIPFPRKLLQGKKKIQAEFD